MVIFKISSQPNALLMISPYIYGTITIQFILPKISRYFTYLGTYKS